MYVVLFVSAIFVNKVNTVIIWLHVDSRKWTRVWDVIKSVSHASRSIHLDVFCSRNPYLAIQPLDIEQVTDQILI
jgi:hypothetical protein